ncbi:MAG: hypothetical protein SNF93_01235 [Rikenellaceae bacterium]
MKGFTPFKKHAKEFNYTPRFYDAQKEERDRRRAELRGSRPEGDEQGEYVAGEYLRRQREAREAKRARKNGDKKSSMWMMVMGVALVFLMAYMLLPRLIEAFMSGAATTEKYEPRSEFEEFDPYAPIRVIPND